MNCRKENLYNAGLLDSHHLSQNTAHTVLYTILRSDPLRSWSQKELNTEVITCYPVFNTPERPGLDLGMALNTKIHVLKNDYKITL